MIKRIILFELIICVMVNAETNLSGKIGGMTFDSTGNPFLITQEIIIEENKTVTINPGCVFMFSPFTGMVVNGNVVVKGEKANPVIFTSKNDNNYNKDFDTLPQPFDWNGITITPKARLVNMENFYLAYSVYGLKSLKDTLSIVNGVFSQNGQFHFTINNKIQMVKENFPFTYELKPQMPKILSPVKAITYSSIIPGSGLVYAGSWKLGLLYALGTFGTAAGSLLLGEKNPGKTCGTCNGISNEGQEVSWEGCIDGEWNTTNPVFTSPGTFFEEVKNRQDWRDNMGGNAQVVEKSKFTPNIPLIVTGSTLYLVNVIHSGIVSKKKNDTTKKLMAETFFDHNSISFNMKLNF